jgi:hypothetical protein
LNICQLTVIVPCNLYFPQPSLSMACVTLQCNPTHIASSVCYKPVPIFRSSKSSLSSLSMLHGVASPKTVTSVFIFVRRTLGTPGGRYVFVLRQLSNRNICRALRGFDWLPIGGIVSRNSFMAEVLKLLIVLVPCNLYFPQPSLAMACVTPQSLPTQVGSTVCYKPIPLFLSSQSSLFRVVFKIPKLHGIQS